VPGFAANGSLQSQQRMPSESACSTVTGISPQPTRSWTNSPMHTGHTAR
jgi:hypothetical protein